MDLKVVIPSRGRSDTITTHELMPYADVVVPESQVAEYSQVCDNVSPVPDEVAGMGAIRQWVLDNYEQEVVVMADDDVTAMFCVSALSAYDMTGVDSIWHALLSAAVCARDLGVSLFGFNQGNGDARKYQPGRPFSLTSWIGGVVGVVGRRVRWNPKQRLKADVDAVMEALLKDRILWVDQRFSFVQHRDHNKGGNEPYRGSTQTKTDILRLESKWGRHLKWTRKQHHEVPTINVRRANPEVHET